MNFEEIKSGVSKMTTQVIRLKESYQRELQEKFHQVVKEFFEQTPEVRAIVWQQTIPYFNDGDPCVFGVEEIFFLKTDLDFDNLSSPWTYEGDSISIYSWLDVTQKLADENGVSIQTLENCRGFSSMMNQMEDLLEEVYGSNSRVYLSKDRAVAEEYLDHD